VLAESILKLKNTKVVALGAKGDGNLLDNTRIIDITGCTSIKTLAAVITRCGVVIGGDTGPVHLASALGVPAVAIFGGSDINETAPVNGKIKLISKHLSCSPCRTRPSCRNYPCLTGIKPEEVYKTIEEILEI
jgi:ADP-heptose:LPS heptosyltransferase